MNFLVVHSLIVLVHFIFIHFFSAANLSSLGNSMNAIKVLNDQTITDPNKIVIKIMVMILMVIIILMCSIRALCRGIYAQSQIINSFLNLIHWPSALIVLEIDNHSNWNVKKNPFLYQVFKVFLYFASLSIDIHIHKQRKSRIGNRFEYKSPGDLPTMLRFISISK